MALTNASAPCMAIPNIRNGMSSNQTSGYRTNARSATGQHSRNRKHQSTKVSIFRSPNSHTSSRHYLFPEPGDSRLNNFFCASRKGRVLAFAAFHCGLVVLFAMSKRPSATIRSTRAMLS